MNYFPKFLTASLLFIEISNRNERSKVVPKAKLFGKENIRFNERSKENIHLNERSNVKSRGTGL